VELFRSFPEARRGRQRAKIIPQNHSLVGSTIWHLCLAARYGRFSLHRVLKSSVHLLFLAPFFMCDEEKSQSETRVKWSRCPSVSPDDRRSELYTQILPLRNRVNRSHDPYKIDGAGSPYKKHDPYKLCGVCTLFLTEVPHKMHGGHTKCIYCRHTKHTTFFT
jgi:hypothetical protein